MIQVTIMVVDKPSNLLPIFCCIPLILVELRRPGAIKQKFKKFSTHCVLIIYCNVADTIMLHVKSYILQVQYDWVVCENINEPSPCDSSLVLKGGGANFF